MSEPSVGGFDGAALGNARLSVRARAVSNTSGDSSDPRAGSFSDPDDAPTRIDPPHGYSHGDDLETLRIDEHERNAWWVPARDPGGFVNDITGTPSSLASTSGPGSYAWPPPLGRGWVARFARAAWALVAALGAFRAAWRCFGVVLFLAPDSAPGPRMASALDAALLESLAGLAQGALVGLVLAPAAAAAMAWLFEIVLRASERLAAPRLARTLAPATAKTEKERAARAAVVSAGRDAHYAFARLKTAAHEACEARQTAARRALQAWTQPAVAIALCAAGIAAVAGTIADAAARAAALRLEATAFACVAGAMALLQRVDRAAVARVREEMEAREREFLAEQHRGTFLCRWRADDYAAPGERNQTSADKALTNAAVAAAAAASAAWRGVPPSAAPALILDAADGRTATALAAAQALGREDRRARRRRRRRRWFRGKPGSARSGEIQTRSLEDAFPDLEDASASFDEAAEDDASFADDPSVAFEQSVSFGSREREKGDRLAAFEFPPAAVFVPNQHTHVVCALRRATASFAPKCTAFAADVRDVLARRAPTAAPFHLVYLDHCGAVAQREQQIWDVFSRHAVADGGVVAVTFSTRGKRKGWSKAAAVGACARMLVEAADAHGYELRGGAADGGGCASEPDADMSRLMDYAVRVDSHAADEIPGAAVEGDENGAPTGTSGATEAAQRAHAKAIEDALDAYLRACDAVGGVDAAFSGRGAKIDDVSGGGGVAAATAAARALARALHAWAADTPSGDDGRAAMLDTWATRRRRRMCGYVFSRVVLGKDVDDAENLRAIEAGALGSTVRQPANASDLEKVEKVRGEGTAATTSGVSSGDARTLASLGREAAKAAAAAAALATAPITTARDMGTDLSSSWRGAPGGELRFERCFFLYGTLMFFVFRVRVKDPRRLEARGVGA